MPVAKGFLNSKRTLLMWSCNSFYSIYSNNWTKQNHTKRKDNFSNEIYTQINIFLLHQAIHIVIAGESRHCRVVGNHQRHAPINSRCMFIQTVKKCVLLKKKKHSRRRREETRERKKYFFSFILLAYFLQQSLLFCL